MQNIFIFKYRHTAEMICAIGWLRFFSDPITSDPYLSIRRSGERQHHPSYHQLFHLFSQANRRFVGNPAPIQNKTQPVNLQFQLTPHTHRAQLYSAMLEMLNASEIWVEVNSGQAVFV